MSLLEQIKADQLNARKAKDTVVTNLLTTLIAEASKVSDEDFKKGNTQITDAKVQSTIRKFVKNAEETKLAVAEEFTRSVGLPPNDGNIYLVDEGQRAHIERLSPKLEVVSREIAILNAYLPTQLSEDKLRTIIDEFRVENPDANVGAVMSYLKANYEGLYDGKLASTLAKG